MIKKSHNIPKKHYGQHFLVNPRAQQHIIDACELNSTDTVLEIGPGEGALTQHLVQKVRKIIAIEKDPQLVSFLEEHFTQPTITIKHQDILKYSFRGLPNNTVVIGNLPYNISTPILETLIAHKNKFKVIYITVQLEYGQRLLSKPHSKTYGALSCFIRYHFDIKKLFTIGRSSFFPAPKVQSCFLKLTPKQKNPDIKNEKHLFRIIHLTFGQRRKTILNTLAPLMDKTSLQALLEKEKINPKLRAENLSLEDFIRLANLIK